MRCKPVFIVSAVQLFFNFMLKFFSRNEKPPHGPRVVACLLRFPHLMHLDFPTESLHCSVLWLLLSPFLLHKLSESFSFGTVHFCLFIPQPAHENAPHTRYKLECPSLLVSWLRIWPQPFALRPQLIKFIPFHIPFRNKLLILRHGLLFVSVRCAFTCFTSKFKIFSAHSANHSQSVVHKSASFCFGPLHLSSLLYTPSIMLILSVWMTERPIHLAGAIVEVHDSDLMIILCTSSFIVPLIAYHGSLLCRSRAAPPPNNVPRLSLALPSKSHFPLFCSNPAS